MDDLTDDEPGSEKRLVVDPSDYQASRRGCLPAGCALGCLIPAVLFLVICGGLGFPNRHWLYISDVQAFEGPDGVVIFAQVEREMLTPELLQDHAIRRTVQLLRFDVSPNGTVTKTELQILGSPHWISFSTNIHPILRLADGFYILDEPSMGQPYCILYRIADDHFEPLTRKDSEARLAAEQLTCGGRRFNDFDELNIVSVRHDWRRMNASSSPGFTEDSDRYAIRVRCTDDFESGAIEAESLSETTPWSHPLLSVSKARWKSYRGIDN